MMRKEEGSALRVHDKCVRPTPTLGWGKATAPGAHGEWRRDVNTASHMRVQSTSLKEKAVKSEACKEIFAVGRSDINDPQK